MLFINEVLLKIAILANMHKNTLCLIKKITQRWELRLQALLPPAISIPGGTNPFSEGKILFILN